MKTADALDYEVRRYREEDEPRVLKLLDASLGGGPAGHRTGEFFRWKHFENPFGRSYLAVAHSGERIIGLRAFMRWEFVAGDRMVRAVRAVDTATHSDFQGMGVFKRLTLLALEDLRAEADLVFNTPNEKSLPGYLKMGWHTVGRLPVFIRTRHPLRVLRGLRSARKPTQERAGPSVEAVTAEEALRDAEGLSLLLEVERDQRLATHRHIAYLRWRYGRAPLLDYRAVRVEREGEVAGLAIFRVRPRGLLWEATVAEVLVHPRDVRMSGRLLAAVAGAARVDHVACSFPPGWAQRSALRRRGFIRAPGGVTLVTNSLSDVVPDPGEMDSWSLALGDVEVF